MSKEKLSWGNGATGGSIEDESLELKAPPCAMPRTVAVLDQQEHSHLMIKDWLEDSCCLRLSCWREATIESARQIALSPTNIALVEAHLDANQAIQCVYLLKRLQPELTVITFADVANFATCFRCYQAGADSYVTTPQTPQRLEEIVQCAIQGIHLFPAEIATIIVDHWRRRFVLPDKSVLTESEAAVMAAVIQGKFDKEIANDRSTTHGTVHSILHGIYAKIGARCRAEAVARFLPLGEAFTIARQIVPAKSRVRPRRSI